MAQAMLLVAPVNHNLCSPDPNVNGPTVDKLLEADGFDGIANKFWAKACQRPLTLHARHAFLS